MKVKTLIEQLSSLDKDTEIVFYCMENKKEFYELSLTKQLLRNTGYDKSNDKCILRII